MSRLYNSARLGWEWHLTSGLPSWPAKLSLELFFSFSETSFDGPWDAFRSHTLFSTKRVDTRAVGPWEAAEMKLVRFLVSRFFAAHKPRKERSFTIWATSQVRSLSLPVRCAKTAKISSLRTLGWAHFPLCLPLPKIVMISNVCIQLCI